MQVQTVCCTTHALTYKHTTCRTCNTNVPLALQRQPWQLSYAIKTQFSDFTNVRLIEVCHSLHLIIHHRFTEMPTQT